MRHSAVALQQSSNLGGWDDTTARDCRLDSFYHHNYESPTSIVHQGRDFNPALSDAHDDLSRRPRSRQSKSAMSRKSSNHRHILCH